MGYFIVLIMSWIDSLLSKGKGIIIAAVAFFWMAYLGGAASPLTTTDYPDYQNSYIMLSKGIQGRFEWMYTYLSNYAIQQNFDYAKFRLWLISAIFLILFISVIRLTNKPILFAAFFLIFPFFNEVTQVRSFSAYTIVLFGLSFLKNDLNFKNIIIFEFATFIAMGFHSSAGIFLLVPVFIFIVRKMGFINSFKRFGTLTIFFTALLLLLSSGKFFVKIISNILNLLVGKSISTTFTNLMSISGGNEFTFFEVSITYWMLLYLIYFFVKNVSCLSYLKTNELFISCFSLSLFIGFLSPLLLISVDLVRFQRFGFEILIILISILYGVLQKNHVENKILLLISILLICVAGWSIYSIYGPLFIQSIPHIGHFVKN